ncbi:sensor histidine kinase [Gryllotalpicola daejeonensis]|uniref:histidine kinase n=1 Tax=Gryllotalpicola daejeonensis TaxID=993087 RepID=A0ABP7ZFL5_9MICO
MRELTRRQLGVDLGIAVAFALVSLVFARHDGQISLIPLTVAAAAVAFRRLSPGLALGIAWAAALIQMSAGLSPALYDLGVCIVLYASAAYGGEVVRWLGLSSAIGGAIIATIYLQFRFEWFTALLASPGVLVSELRSAVAVGAGILALLVLSWVSGQLARSIRVGRETSRREELARHDADIAEYRVVVEQERNRIARDMHDVVAHSLAVVIAQADGARFAASARPDLAVTALGTISSVARDALGEVRMLLAELRHDEGSTPQPTVVDFDALFEQLRGAGLELRVHESGERRPLGTGHELAAYRIVQEGLTNALRHGAPGAPVDLTLFWADDGLHLELVNDVPEAPDDAPALGRGHGLPGMHERAQLAGGFLAAEPDAEGHFRLRARVPAA